MELTIRELTLMAAMAMSSWAIAAEPTTSSVTPDDALSRLKAGNERFANSKESAIKERRQSAVAKKARLPSE